MSAGCRRKDAAQVRLAIIGLATVFPGAFAEAKPQAPAFGVHRAILVAVEPAIMAGTITVKDIKRALAHYTRTDGVHQATRCPRPSVLSRRSMPQ